jgi:hypothetical protein
VKLLGELEPLPILSYVWNDISMGLPKSGNKSVIMVDINRLSKYAHFFYLQHPFKVFMIAQVFMHNIFKLLGMIQSIDMNCYPTFTSNFWQELV